MNTEAVRNFLVERLSAKAEERLIPPLMIQARFDRDVVEVIITRMELLAPSERLLEFVTQLFATAGRPISRGFVEQALLDAINCVNTPSDAREFARSNSRFEVVRIDGTEIVTECAIRLQG